jgi:hypothetical protein
MGQSGHVLLEPKSTCNLQVYFGRQASVGIIMIFAGFATGKYLYVQHTQNTTTCSEAVSKHNKPWQPPSHHDRHSAPPPALRHRNISQQAMQQRYIVKNRISYH